MKIPKGADLYAALMFIGGLLVIWGWDHFCIGKSISVLNCGMSAIGTKQIWASAPHISAFGCKADMPFCTANVCF